MVSPTNAGVTNPTPVKGWTHPRHNRVAIAGSVVSALTVGLDLLVVLHVPWFIDGHAEKNAKYISTFLDFDVDCSNNYCMKSNGAMADWQNVAKYLVFVSLASSVASFLVQLLLFWPLVLSGRVFCNLLRISRTLDFYGSPFKFAAAFTYIFHSGQINYHYAWMVRDRLLQLETAPIGLMLFSYIFQVLSFLAMTVAIDKGPRGGPNYWELLQAEAERLLAEKLESPSNLLPERRRSSYLPDPTEEHSRILAGVKKTRESKQGLDGEV